MITLSICCLHFFYKNSDIILGVLQFIISILERKKERKKERMKNNEGIEFWSGVSKYELRERDREREREREIKSLSKREKKGRKKERKKE